jgi:hypothetical protein
MAHVTPCLTPRPLTRGGSSSNPPLPPARPSTRSWWRVTPAPTSWRAASLSWRAWRATAAALGGAGTWGSSREEGARVNEGHAE